MRLKSIFKICKNLALKQLEVNPNTKFKVEGEQVYLKDMVTELDDLTNWCYKEELDVQKVVRCKNCKYYKKYKLKNPRYHNTFVYMCSCTKTKRQPDFFCAEGCEKE